MSALTSCSSAPRDKVIVNGRVLLTYEGADGDQTDYSGALGENASHCITVGKFVVLAPEGSTLLDDGSVKVAGHTWKPGSNPHISGSGSPIVPKDSPCHSPATGYWTSATTWR